MRSSTGRAITRNVARISSRTQPVISSSRPAINSRYSTTLTINSGFCHCGCSGLSCLSIDRFEKLNQVNTIRLSSSQAASGSICTINATTLSLPWLHSRMFCGLPTGVSRDPALTASASKMISREMGKWENLRSVSVSGTRINSATSLVRNVESNAAASTINSASARSCRKRAISRPPSTSK